MTGKVKFTMAQRQFLAKAFNDDFRNHKIHVQLGPYLKAFYQECVRLYFMPLKAADLPGIPVESKELKDLEGNLIDIEYTITIVLNFNQVNDNTEVILTKPFRKSFIDNVY